MGEYFECELKLNDKDETFVAMINLKILPRIGEHIGTIVKGSMHRFKVTDIWHWAGDKKTGHRITIYVNHTGK
ncbi:hypothetical protein A3842_11115 [Paenibacillus sp. P3E]|uniref:hypothetical protein n=1 Tax=unclassified Paenibacillus TaxID=185978 RepID=UPI00093CDA3A|nr:MULTISPECIES: hypothetical protein [unclassified Paenibacillus]OKP81621.1 hypothetical protein A3842_11115 [Paenibacillus sp. P3E]OKP91403.1 hypothetical protein A3848_09875 [Paenibacillus sp. P32E]